uniref:ATP synthase complex subunit 8 n=1 Tax=Graptodytes eremitus TaxID=992549 RepID=A0A894K8J8_9DYTI|nr:ATP synthase F0 subunit 8 [Graptodytes eremitus]
MPQMAPMNWIILYMMFSIIFILFNFMNFYTFMITKNSNQKKNIFKKILNWKW